MAKIKRIWVRLKFLLTGDCGGGCAFDRKMGCFIPEADCIIHDYSPFVEGWQPSHCYCECGHETLQDPLSKIYEAGSSTNIICSSCGLQTNWDLDAPVPIKLRTIR